MYQNGPTPTGSGGARCAAAGVFGRRGATGPPTASTAAPASPSPASRAIAPFRRRRLRARRRASSISACSASSSRRAGAWTVIASTGYQSEASFTSFIAPWGPAAPACAAPGGTPPDHPPTPCRRRSTPAGSAALPARPRARSPAPAPAAPGGAPAPSAPGPRRGRGRARRPHPAGAEPGGPRPAPGGRGPRRSAPWRRQAPGTGARRAQTTPPRPARPRRRRSAARSRVASAPGSHGSTTLAHRVDQCEPRAAQSRDRGAGGGRSADRRLLDPQRDRSVRRGADASGRLPYRDFLWAYGPAQPYLQAALFRLMGVSLLQWRVEWVAACAGISVVAWLAVRDCAPGWVAITVW